MGTKNLPYGKFFVLGEEKRQIDFFFLFGIIEDVKSSPAGAFFRIRITAYDVIP